MYKRSAMLLCFCFALIVSVLSSTAFSQINTEEILKQFSWRNIGPANMKGRVTDIEAVENNFKIAYMAAASGGVWKTVNAGTTWEPIFDDYGVASIGDIAIFQKNPDIVWVGTGEANNRNSVAWGDGIYKSTDGGKTFQNMGLKDTHQIAKIRIHPNNPDIVYVAAAGHLWGWSGERGIFKTTDGGKTWKKLTNGLPGDEKHGGNDLVMDPSNPNVLYATMYQRQRKPYRYDGGSEAGGIYKTTNGGNTWRKLIRGLPEGPLGRIGIDISRSNPNILMAFVDATPPKEWLEANEWGTVRGAMNKNTDVPGPGVYRTENGGQTWQYVNTFQNRPLYFSKIRINPTDPDKVYVLAQNFRKSDDGGKTLRTADRGLHPDHHAMWIDPTDGDRYYLGTDGGVYLTQDHGDTYISFHTMTISQFYAVGVDMRDPYYVYGGLQDNGSWGGPSVARNQVGILNQHWKFISGGDGFHVQIDPTDWRTVYSESQGGRIGRRNVETGESAFISPNASNVINWSDYVPSDWRPERPRQQFFRFNWSSPIIMSKHNPRTIYFGGNHVFKTVDRGDHWKIISPDLSTNNPDKFKPSGGISPDNTSAEVHGTIISIAESPLKPGLLWAGTDDGNVQITRDGGITWKNLTNNIPGVPRELWVSRLEASYFDEGTAYLTIDGHRSDSFQPWVFKTDNYGETWTNIANNIPDGHAMYVIKQDPKNKNLLFAGSEFALFASLDEGQTWHNFNNNMPPVAIHDLVIHPRDGDLIAATHGRGMWIMDDITPLQQLNEDVLAKEAAILANRQITRWLRTEGGWERYNGDLVFKGENPPANTAYIHFYLAQDAIDDVIIDISDITGNNKKTLKVEGKAGLNKVKWNMRLDPSPLQTELQMFRRQYSRESDADKKKQILAEGRSRLLEMASSSQERNMVQQQIRFIEMGFGGGRGGRVSGSSAPAGEYLLQFNIDGNEYTGKLKIRNDPLIDKK